jgi:hypothetical protein
MTSTMTTLVQHALASDPLSTIVTVVDALLAMLLLTTLSEREILRSRLRGEDHFQSRALAAVIPPLLVVGAIFMTVRLAELLN